MHLAVNMDPWFLHTDVQVVANLTMEMSCTSGMHISTTKNITYVHHSPLWKQSQPKNIHNKKSTQGLTTQGFVTGGLDPCELWGGSGGWAGGRMWPPLRDNSKISSLSASISCAWRWTSCISRWRSWMSAWRAPLYSLPCRHTQILLVYWVTLDRWLCPVFTVHH